MSPLRSLRAIPVAAFLSVLPALASAAGRTPIYPGPASAELASYILFETAFPLNDLLPSQWTPAQMKEVAYIQERMKKDDRIFLLIQVTTDPVGSRAENGNLAMDISQAVAERLRESGIPPDRMLILPGESDYRLFDAPRWGGVDRLQKVVVRGLQGGPWLKRRGTATAARQELPQQDSIRILEPAVGSTDRSRHLLRGTTGAGIRSVAVVVGKESRTAAVYGETFEVPISLSPGDNRITVTALDPFGRALHATREVRYVPPRPSIEVVSPRPDAVADLSRTPVITVTGVIRSRNPVRQAYLIQNDTPRNIHFQPDGSFSQQAVLVTDEDFFTVEAVDAEGESGISEARKVSARGIAERPLMAILHWDDGDADLDLHVTDQKGRHTWFDAPDVLESATAIPSGKLWLDNRKGYGPEVFTVEDRADGTYTFSVQYYRGRRPCKAYLTLVLFAGSPSRRLVRLFGPLAVAPGGEPIPIAEVSFPAGTARDLTGETRKDRR